MNTESDGHSRKDENGNQGGPYVWACGKNHLKADNKAAEWTSQKEKINVLMV